ncbi:Geranylgeranyl transferase type-2 subunit alpha 1 [Camellia lanceoleosa]|uniref:Geranylgeranyl transferase type-2 subunit alpha 1 n=1 Tax=Camellia lanceoleosa TaxID=1840588 RepID=A0ACC0G0T3_9ERIC|nr:Geranylgeranyl transferase type-2 subunit alpha 1 [Camellia lanceoleosa]
MCKLFSYTKEALEVNAKLLEANPEYLTAWNYRKFAVEHILNHSETDTEIDPDSIKSIYSEELRVRALAKNYRPYGAWYHRKWVLSKGHSSVDQELQLLVVFLKKDSRNFHAWNYQRFVAALKNRSDEEELHFTTDLINENFSNYSSWHNCRAQGSFSKAKVLTEEYDFVHQALFTDSDDQSGWLYHFWLLEQTVKVENPLLVSTWPPHGSNLNILTTPSLDPSPTISRSSSLNSRAHIEEELKQVFNKFDVNGDGKISSSELGSILSSLDYPATDEELTMMIRGRF